MKTLTAILAFVTLLPVSAALADEHKHDAHAAQAPAATSYAASGEVKKLDAKTGSVTIAHGPVETLNWPPMTMVFKARDKAVLDKLKVGQKINFEFMQDKKGYVITAVK